MGKRMVRKPFVCSLSLLISKAIPYVLFSVTAFWFSFQTVGWAAESEAVAGLRERIAILDQARVKAAVELTVKEQQGSVTSRDRQHYQTVLTFLEQQIADSCRQLIEKGGLAAVIELPCSASTVARQKDEEQQNVEESEVKADEKLQEEVIPETQQSLPATTQPEPSPAVVPVKKENVEKKEVRQQPPEPGIVESIRRWLESLFAPKPPPAKSSSETGRSPEQQESTGAEKQNSRQSSESITQPVEQGAEANDKDSATGTGSKEQPENSAGMEKPFSEEELGAQKQEQQQLKNGDKQPAEKNTEQTAGQEVSSSDNSLNKAGNVQNGQEGEQSQGSNSINLANGAAEKATSQAGDGSAKDKAGQGSSLSETGDTVAADSGKSVARQGTSQNDGTGQQTSAQSAGQSIAEAGTSQPASVQSGSEEKEEAGHGAQAGFGSSPDVDTEVSRLETSLNEALEEFDGQLLSEQERLAARAPRQREGSAAGGGGYGAQGPPGPAGGYGSPNGEQGNGRAGSGGYAQPGGIAAGGGKPALTVGRSTIDYDDDIVARQLREAAEKETDPVLQEKLWQEYRKYKQGDG